MRRSGVNLLLREWRGQPLNSHVESHDNGPERTVRMSAGDEGQHRIPHGFLCHLQKSLPLLPHLPQTGTSI